ncbi:DNA-directed RNA polymerase subunit omega [Clostridium sp. B9]|uniref:DNA-directed RNA polymerase subunit omega n=1 Tax=Clostridium sp. B9 TaxID=3423224 RepID=UPI003D2EB00C
MNNSMINPSIVELLKRVEDRYSLVLLSSKRARQIIDGAETFVDVESNKPLTIAINEIDRGYVTYTELGEK